jgi:hypothetical protein
MPKSLALFFFFICSLANMQGHVLTQGVSSHTNAYSHGTYAHQPFTELHAPFTTAFGATEEETRSEEESFGHAIQNFQHQVLRNFKQSKSPNGKRIYSLNSTLRLFALYHCWRAEL